MVDLLRKLGGRVSDWLKIAGVILRVLLRLMRLFEKSGQKLETTATEKKSKEAENVEQKVNSATVEALRKELGKWEK